MSVGDRVWIYVNRKYVDNPRPYVREIRSIVRIAGPIKHLAKSPWKSGEGRLFTVARDITIERRIAVPGTVLTKMSFALRPPMWGMRLMGAPLRLTERGVGLVERAL